MLEAGSLSERRQGVPQRKTCIGILRHTAQPYKRGHPPCWHGKGIEDKAEKPTGTNKGSDMTLEYKETTENKKEE